MTVSTRRSAISRFFLGTQPTSSWAGTLAYEKPAAVVAVIRFVVYGVILYKLASRDFSIYGYAPSFVLDVYPADSWVARADYFWPGVSWVVDLFTFHWIHWAVPMPGAETLQTVQIATFAACSLVILLGRGPKRLYAISSYVLIAYLWGFQWRTGNPVDSMFTLLPLTLLYTLFSEKEAWVLVGRERAWKYSRANGWFFAMALLCFIAYYVPSGINKLVDIPVSDWFLVDVVELVEYYHDSERTSTSDAYLDFVYHLVRGKPWSNDLGVIAVYISHVLTALMLFRRELVSKTVFFYWGFHILVMGIGIAFFGVMLSLLALVPFHRVLQPMEVRIPERNRRLERFVRLANRLYRARITVEPRRTFEVTPEGSPRAYRGARAFRHVAWALPLAWPLLPFLYLPGALTLASRWLGAPSERRLELTPATTGTAAGEPVQDVLRATS